MTIDKQLDRVLAVDGGGSKTIAWIANVFPSDGPCRVELQVIGRGVAGPSNPRSVGFEVAFANLDVAVTAALEQAAIDSTSIGLACLSLAGAGRVEEQNQVRAWADARRLAKKTLVIDDVEPLRMAALYEQVSAPSAEPSDWERSVTLVVPSPVVAMGETVPLESVDGGIC
jgi:N-acetylglucosamine kinase-like BadF-type ATPase